MRLFFDANELTYIALFESYLCEGTKGEFDASVQTWTALQSTAPTANVIREVEALRVLYLVDERAHFDWLCSDIAIDEVLKIRSKFKRECHYDLLDRLIEHRNDVYREEGRRFTVHERRDIMSHLFPKVSDRMRNDVEQYCEAILVKACYFLTNDAKLAKVAAATNTAVTPSTVSDLPFVAEWLPAAETK